MDEFLTTKLATIAEDDQRRRCMKAFAKIVLACTGDAARLLRDMGERCAATAMERLEEAYNAKTAPRIMQLQSSLNHHTYDSCGRSIAKMRAAVMADRGALRDIGGDAVIPDTSILQKVVTNIPLDLFGAEISRILALPGPVNLEQAFTALAVWEAAFEKQHSEMTLAVGAASASAPPRSSQPPPRTLPGGSGCWNCGSRQHVRLQCSRPPANCTRCHKSGHATRFCEERERIINARNRGRGPTQPDDNVVCHLGLSTSQPFDDNVWVCDSGASVHVTGDKRYLVSDIEP